jgi:protein O-GlcNAc transferase
MDTRHIQEWFKRALSDHQAGRLPAAAAGYHRVLTALPDHADALHLLGVLFQQQEESVMALALIRQAIALRQRAIGMTEDLGLPDAHPLQQESAAAPVPPAEAAMVAQTVARSADSQAAFPLDTVLGRYYSNLGEVYRRRQQWSEAEACFRRSLAHDPRQAAAWNNLGLLLGEQARQAESMEACGAAIALDPAYADAHFNLGNALKASGMLQAAIEAYTQAVTLRPAMADAFNNIGNCQRDLGLVPLALRNFEKALAISPEDAGIHSNWLMTALYDPTLSEVALQQAHQHWVRQHTQRLARRFPGKERESPDKRLRIGYVSPDFCEHAVARFLEPLLLEHDRSAFDTLLYAEVRHRDQATARFRQLATGWRETNSLSDEELVRQIMEDQVDILVDLAGHTARNRLRVFASRPAPIQLSYLGYPHPVELPEIDGSLTDVVLDPTCPSSAAAGCAWLHPCFCCFHPNSETPAVGPLPARQRGYVTFGSLHGLMKLNDQVLDTWSEILRALPEARMHLFRDHLHGSAQARLRNAFAQRGIASERLTMEHTVPPGSSYWEQYHGIDISLDCFPWSGHTIGTEALWMGVPVVTWAGPRRAQRLMATILECLQLSAWVTTSVRDYVATAVSLASDLSALEAWRSSLRERMRASPLGDGRRLMRQLEGIYRALWQEWLIKAKGTS